MAYCASQGGDTFQVGLTNVTVDCEIVGFVASAYETTAYVVLDPKVSRGIGNALNPAFVARRIALLTVNALGVQPQHKPVVSR